MGLANKIMYDEVPAGTDPLSPENKIVFAVGPLTASGVPLAGRTTISLSVHVHQGSSSRRRPLRRHDRRGASSWPAGMPSSSRALPTKPVYLQHRRDDQVEIKDAADQVWGHGHPRHHRGALPPGGQPTACVATIGPAGENLLPYAVIINSRNHSAGAGAGRRHGLEEVQGAGRRGQRQPVNVRPTRKSRGRPVRLHAARDRRLQQQPCRAFHPAGVGRVLRQGQPLDCSARDCTWADWPRASPIETGEPKPGEINTVGLPLHEDHQGRRSQRPRSTPSRWTAATAARSTATPTCACRALRRPTAASRSRATPACRTSRSPSTW